MSPEAREPVNTKVQYLRGRSQSAPPTRAACRSSHPHPLCPVGRGGGRGGGRLPSGLGLGAEVTVRASVSPPGPSQGGASVLRAVTQDGGRGGAPGTHLVPGEDSHAPALHAPPSRHRQRQDAKPQALCRSQVDPSPTLHPMPSLGLPGKALNWSLSFLTVNRISWEDELMPICQGLRLSCCPYGDFFSV